MGSRIPWRQVILSLGIGGVILWRIPFKNLRIAFRGLERGNLLVAVLFTLALLVLRAYKWHCLMSAAGNYRLRQSLRTLLGGCALGLITPGRVGELGRCVFVRKQERTQVAVLTFLDRSLDFWGLITLVGASLFFIVPQPAAIFGVAVWLALLPAVLGLPGIVAQFSLVMRWSRHLHAACNKVAAGLPPIQILKYASMSVGAMWLELSSFFFLLRAFSPADYSTAVATYPYIALAGDLPFSISGVGIREGAAALFLSPYAVSSGSAVDATLLWFVFAILLPAALGLGWLAVERLRPYYSAGRPVRSETALRMDTPAPGPTS